MRDISSLHFRNPDVFIAGQLHLYSKLWERIADLSSYDRADEVLDWTRNKVSLYTFSVKLLKGHFDGLSIILICHPIRNLADEQLISRIQAQEQLLSAEGSDSVDVGLIPEIFRAEVMKSCNMYEYATMWHMQAAGAVVKRKIKNVYSETTPEVTVFF